MAGINIHIESCDPCPLKIKKSRSCIRIGALKNYPEIPDNCPLRTKFQPLDLREAVLKIKPVAERIDFVYKNYQAKNISKDVALDIINTVCTGPELTNFIFNKITEANAI